MNKVITSLIIGIVLGTIISSSFYYTKNHTYHTDFEHRRTPSKEILSKTKCNCDGNRKGGYWDLTHRTWITPSENDPLCQKHDRQCLRFRPNRSKDVTRVIQCLTKHKRIVMVGDSVHRGIFWSLVHSIQTAIAAAPPSSFISQLNATVVKRFKAKKFTNFQDQDLLVKNSAGQELFSVRFVYGSNAIDFPQRCNLISQWFFQCLKPVEDILHALLQEETERHQTLQQLQQQQQQQQQLNLRHKIKIDSVPVGVLYWNTGLWDWRTGRSPLEYEQGVRKVLNSPQSRPVFDSKFAKQVVWRTVSASWPDKFMNSDECEQKPHSTEDPRPCSVHTSDLINYNSLTTNIMIDHGFQVVDSFPITSGRPDLSYDGLHFESKVSCFDTKKNKQRDVKGDLDECKKDVDQIYQMLNDAFLNNICPSS